MAVWMRIILHFPIGSLGRLAGSDRLTSIPFSKELECAQGEITLCWQMEDKAL